MSAEKNQFLNVGTFIQSNNSCFRLIMQNDGNLVLYNLKARLAMWATGTDGSVKSLIKFSCFYSKICKIGIQQPTDTT